MLMIVLVRMNILMIKDEYVKFIIQPSSLPNRHSKTAQSCKTPTIIFVEIQDLTKFIPFLFQLLTIDRHNTRHFTYLTACQIG